METFTQVVLAGVVILFILESRSGGYGRGSFGGGSGYWGGRRRRW